MKRDWRKWGVWAVAGFILTFWLPSMVRAETIADFSVALSVDAAGTLSVDESIEYDFGLEDQHGIFRLIPVSYERDGFRYRLRLSLDTVQRDGADEPYTTSRRGDDLEIKIGHADRTISGRHQYRIVYTVRRALNWFDGRPELYWNATGNGWTVPIERSEVTVSAPALPKVAGDYRCYTGSAGSTAQDCSIATIETLGEAADSQLAFSRGVPLAATEGLTVVVRLPADSVRQPGPAQVILDFFRDNFGFGLPVVTLLVMVLLYRRFGKDPSGRGTIIAEYEPPQKLSPAMVGYLLDETVDPRDITASMLNLAVKGHLSIEYVDKTFGHTYRLVKKPGSETVLTGFERQLRDAIFSSGSPVLLFDLKRTFGAQLPKLKSALQADAQARQFFVQKPQTVRGIVLGIGIALIIVGVQLFAWLALGIGTIASGIVVLAFTAAMARRTEQGVLVTEQIKGFRHFLSVTDAERIKFHNAPARQPAQFLAFLPYAIALGVEKDWAKQFRDVTIERPDWYTGGDMTTLNAVVFASSLRDFSDTARSQVVAPASAAGSGHSGFGGGGFSGGGFGGGGGGSW